MVNIEFKNQVDKRAIFLLLGCYCSLPRVMLSKYKTNIEDYPEEFHQTVFGAMFNIASKQNVQKITSLDIENEVSQFDGALEIWNTNNGWDYINKAIEMSKDKLDNIGRYYDDVRKYSIIRNATDNLKIDVSFIYDEDDTDIMNNFSTLSSTELLGKINSKFLDFKSQYNNSNEEAYSFKVGDSIRERYTQYKEQMDVWGYPYQSKYLTALTRGMRHSKYVLQSSISGGCKSRQAMTNACNIGCDKIYDWHNHKWLFTGEKQPVLFISTELTQAAIEDCILAHISGIEENRIVKWQNITKEEEKILQQSVAIMEDCQVYGEYLPDFDDDLIEETISRYILKYNISFCFFDYINDSPSLWTYTSNKMKSSRLQTHQILYNFSQTLKLLANKYDIFIGSSTQLNDNYKDSNNKDSSALKGSKAICEKADICMLALPVTHSDLDKLKGIVREDGTFGNQIPNMSYYIFKNRDGDRTRIIVWTYLNLGTMREVDCFVTNYNYELITDIPLIDTLFDGKQIESVDIGDKRELLNYNTINNPIELVNQLED